MSSPTVNLDVAAEEFAGRVGADGDVAIEGLGTRGGSAGGGRAVTAPAGIQWVQPAETTV